MAGMSLESKLGVRLGGMTGSLMGIYLLYRCTIGDMDSLTVFETVYSHCVVILVSLNYYSVYKVIHTICTRSKTSPLAPRDRGQSYVNTQAPASHRLELIQGMPRLTIQNVWTLVYGLGLVFFVTGYCMLGIQPVCLACVAFAIGILSVDELVCPRTPLSPIYLSLRVAALVSSLVSVSMVSMDLIGDMVVQYVTSVDLYSIFFGLCLPFMAQFIMIAVRDARHYSLGTVAQVCEFGLPFTAFLGVFHLSVAYGQRFQINTDVEQSVSPYFDYGSLFNQSWYGPSNFTAQNVIRMDGPFLLFYGVAPLLLGPTIVCYVSCAMNGTAIDPLLSIGMALCIQRLMRIPTGPFSALGIYGMICCVAALLARILCEYQFILEGRERVSLQMESPHLTERVVWTREADLAQRAREMGELTREGGSEPPPSDGGESGSVTPH
jgi:hypothetical protein